MNRDLTLAQAQRQMQVPPEASLQGAPFRFWCASCRPPAVVSSTPTLCRKTSSPPYHPCKPNRLAPTRLRMNGDLEMAFHEDSSSLVGFINLRHRPGRLLEGFKFRDVFFRPDAEVLESASRRQHARFQRPNRLVVGSHTLVQGCSHFRQMLRQYRHTFKQILAERADDLSILRQLLLPPSIGHGPQQRDQRRGRGDHDFLREPLLDDGAIIFERRPQNP